MSAYRERLRPARLAAHRLAQQKLKAAVFAAYGGAHCVCCGENTWEFLSMDHIGGAKTPNKERSGQNLYRWLKRHGYPRGFRVLCMNCNFAKGHFGQCPHETPVLRLVSS